MPGMQRESQFAVWEMVSPLWIQVHLVCPGYLLHGAAAKGMLGSVVFWAPQPVALGVEGTPFPEVPRARGAEGRRGVGPPAELGVGVWGLETEVPAAVGECPCGLVRAMYA